MATTEERVPAAERAAAAEPAIVTDGLTKRYGNILAVDHLNLTVERGEIFGFLGPNGAGKTTTMRMLLGLISPTVGSARVLGMDIRTDLARILDRTGSIIENPTFYPYLSGRDNLRAVARLTGTPESSIPAILDLMELTDAAGRSFKSYSLGMKQRLAVGSALLTRPDLLILDEPANGLDPAGIVEMRALMKRLKDEGHTVIISSHVLHEIEQICDRIAILSHGKVVVQGDVTTLLAGNLLEIEVDGAERAEAVLRDVPWIEKIERTGNKLTVHADPGRAAEINRILAEQGMYLSELHVHEQSLEQYFLDVTGGAS